MPRKETPEPLKSAWRGSLVATEPGRGRVAIADLGAKASIIRPKRACGMTQTGNDSGRGGARCLQRVSDGSEDPVGGR